MGLIILTAITFTFQGLYENVEEEVIQQELEGVVQKVVQDVTNLYLIGTTGEGAIDWKLEVKIVLPSDIGGFFYKKKFQPSRNINIILVYVQTYSIVYTCPLNINC